MHMLNKPVTYALASIDVSCSYVDVNGMKRSEVCASGQRELIGRRKCKALGQNGGTADL